MRVPLLDSIYRGYAAAATAAPAAQARAFTGAAGGVGPAQPWRVRLVVWAVLLAAVKVWLILGDEIVARPADVWYLLAARNRYWGGSFADNAFLGLPGYPLWLALVDVMGVPLRFAIEFLQIGAAFLLAWCVRRLGHATWVAVLVFAAIVFHPVSLDSNNYVRPDTFYTPVLLVALGFLMLHYISRDIPAGLFYGVAAGAAVALLTLTRPDARSAASWLLVVGVAVLISNVRRKWPWPTATLQATLAVAVPLTVWLGTTLAVRTLNYGAFGVFAESERSAPGFRALENALLSIASDSAHRYVPVPRAARERAYAASPAFARLRSYIEGSEAAVWRRAGGSLADTTDLAGEALMLAVRDAARRAGHASTAAEAEAYYRTAAGELRAACSARRIVCRRALQRQLAAGLPTAARRLTDSFTGQYLKFFQPWAPARDRDDPAAPREVTRLFNEVANRRRPLTRWPRAQVSGWAFVSGDPLASIRVTDADGRVIAFTDAFRERPDLPSAFPEARVSLNTGFSLEFPAIASAQVTADFTTVSGRTFTIPAMRLAQRRTSIVPGAADSELRLNVENVERAGGGQRPLPAAAARLETAISVRYGMVLLALSVAGLLGLLTATFGHRPGARGLPAAGVLGVIGGAVLIGMISVSVADGFTRPLTGYSGVYPLMGLYSALVILALSQGIRTWRARQQPHDRRRHERRTARVDRPVAPLIRP